MSTFNVWLVVSGSHRQNRISYKKGSKFVTDQDMAKFNTLPHAPKYKKLREATEKEILQFQSEKGFTGTPEPQHIEDETDGEELENESPANTPPTDSLSAMTIAELKILAEDEEVDLEGASKKDAILKLIRDARAAVKS